MGQLLGQHPYQGTPRSSPSVCAPAATHAAFLALPAGPGTQRSWHCLRALAAFLALPAGPGTQRSWHWLRAPGRCAAGNGAAAQAAAVSSTAGHPLTAVHGCSVPVHGCSAPVHGCSTPVHGCILQHASTWLQRTSTWLQRAGTWLHDCSTPVNCRSAPIGQLCLRRRASVPCRQRPVGCCTAHHPAVCTCPWLRSRQVADPTCMDYDRRTPM
jgi:hypothetical protein